MAAVDASEIAPVHWPGIVKLMRDAVGTPETEEDEKTPAEIVFAVYGALSAEAHDDGMKEVKEALSGENDFLLVLPAGGGDVVGRDTAIARALRVSRATLTLVAGGVERWESNGGEKGGDQSKLFKISLVCFSCIVFGFCGTRGNDAPSSPRSPPPPPPPPLRSPPPSPPPH